MDKSLRFDQLKNECKLKDSDFYFLELIPLIEMIWADNQNQEPELKLLYKFTAEHIAQINKAAGDVDLVTVDQANDFLQRFAHNKPEQRVIALLRELVVESWQNKRDSEQKELTKQSILDYCLDIAASCVEAYPYEHHQRVTSIEKTLLRELMLAFHIDPERNLG